MSAPEDDTSHAAAVHAWMEGAAQGLSPEDKLVLFERALRAIWQRAHRTLGEVTLGAIVARILYDMAEEFPLIATLEIDAAGVLIGEIEDRALLDGLDDAMRRTLVALLTVIGNLTAEILTPGLHAALASVSLDDGADPRSGGATK